MSVQEFETTAECHLKALWNKKILVRQMLIYLTSRQIFVNPCAMISIPHSYGGITILNIDVEM